MTLRVPADVRSDPLNLVPVTCCVCDLDRAEVIGRGYDFEYLTSPDVFAAHQCNECGNVYVSPGRTCPNLSGSTRRVTTRWSTRTRNSSLVHKIRSRLEARRLLRYCAGAPDGARILDVGCGDGFHLSLLRKYGHPSWTLEGVDLERRRVSGYPRSLAARLGSIEELDLGAERYDVVYTIQTLEHVAAPDRVSARSSGFSSPVVGW